MPRSAFLRGAAAIMPLSLATAPWGLLAGSMAIEANLTPLQGQGLSSIVFAGAAQLVAIGMLKGGAGIFDSADHAAADLAAPVVWNEHALGDLAAARALAHRSGLFAHR
jgi:hypothetical protein